MSPYNHHYNQTNKKRVIKSYKVTFALLDNHFEKFWCSLHFPCESCISAGISIFNIKALV